MGLFRDTDDFFRRRRVEPSHVGPLLVIGSLVALALARELLIEATLVEQMLPGNRTGYLLSPFTVLLYVRIVAGPLAVWAGYAAVFHALSALFGGTGSFRRTLLLTGWGFVPRIATELLKLAITALVIKRVPEPGPFALSQYVAELYNHPLLSIPVALGLVLTLWAMPDLLWVYAVKHARGLTTMQAILVVNVPVGIVVLLTANGLLQPLL